MIKGIFLIPLVYVKGIPELRVDTFMVAFNEMQSNPVTRTSVYVTLHLKHQVFCGTN